MYIVHNIKRGFLTEGAASMRERVLLRNDRPKTPQKGATDGETGTTQNV